MNIKFLWNIVTSPRSTVIGLVGSFSAGAALLFVLNVMGCDLSKLTMDVLSEAAAMVMAPAVVGGVMKDKKDDRENEREHDQAGTA